MLPADTAQQIAQQQRRVAEQALAQA